MRSLALVLATCGCNQLFALSAPELVDSQRVFFDAPVDAPFACPAAKLTPRFSPLLHQVIAQDCRDYTISADRQVGMALCLDHADFTTHAAEGPIDGLLAPVVGLDDPTFELQFLRIAPEGDELLGVYYNVPTYEYRTYRRQPDGSWARDGMLDTTSAYLDVSGMTRLPVRHAMQTGFDSKLHEWIRNGSTTWTEVGAYTASELGVTYPGSPKLSADGLRLMMTTTTTSHPEVSRVFYSARPTIDDRFRPADPLDGIPEVRDAYLSDDCSRIYFTGLQSVFYVQQL